MTKKDTTPAASPPTVIDFKNLKLRFTPYAWSKIVFLSRVDENECGGFGITDGDDPFLVVDVQMVKQEVSPVTVEFDGDDVMLRFWPEMRDAGLAPHQYSRIWIHTHPGNSPHPSSTDEEQLSEYFGSQDYAIMFILAEQGARYCRFQTRVSKPEAGGQGATLLQSEMAVSVDYASRDGLLPFFSNEGTKDQEHQALWKKEHDLYVTEEIYIPSTVIGTKGKDVKGSLWSQTFKKTSSVHTPSSSAKSLPAPPTPPRTSSDFDYADGYDEGHEDGYETGYEAGYYRGYEDGTNGADFRVFVGSEDSEDSEDSEEGTPDTSKPENTSRPRPSDGWYCPTCGTDLEGHVFPKQGEYFHCPICDDFYNTDGSAVTRAVDDALRGEWDDSIVWPPLSHSYYPDSRPWATGFGVSDDKDEGGFSDE